MEKRGFWQRYGLVLVLGIVAVLMVAIKIRYSKVEWVVENENATVILTPTEIPKPTERVLQNMDYPLWQELPYKGEGFVIDRYINESTVVVIPKGLDKKIVEKEVWNWFEENNVATEEMKISWE